jgi:hypothetical protein
MPLVLADRVQESTTSTGTGTITLLGAVTGYQSFSVIGNGNTTYYTIVGVGTTQWETGLGTYNTNGTTLERTAILSSSNNNSLVNFSAGTKNVFVTYPAQSANTTLVPQTLTIGNNGAVLTKVNNINGLPGNASSGGWLLPQAVTLSTFSAKLTTAAKGTSVIVNLKYSTNYVYTNSTLLKTITIPASNVTNISVAVTNVLPAQSTLYLDITQIGSTYAGAGLTAQIGYKYI